VLCGADFFHPKEVEELSEALREAKENGGGGGDADPRKQAFALCYALFSWLICLFVCFCSAEELAQLQEDLEEAREQAAEYKKKVSVVLLRGGVVPLTRSL
jgi:hypothetical protein